MNPTVNVNLDRSCYCDRLGIGAEPHHTTSCPAFPVLIPCPIPPSVTLKVRLGECIDEGREQGSAIPRACAPGDLHHQNCPARPISVTCSISGKTWAETKITECDAADTLSGDALWAAIRAVEDRWALVKALVTGGDWDAKRVTLPLFRQRDAVYADITEIAQLEDRLFDAQVRLDKAAMVPAFSDVQGMSSDPVERSSAEFLAAYVEHLIEQVGNSGLTT